MFEFKVLRVCEDPWQSRGKRAMQSEVFEAIEVTEEAAEQRPELVCCCCFKKCEEVRARLKRAFVCA